MGVAILTKSVASFTRLAYVAAMCITSRVNLLLLFIGKEKTHMATLFGVQIRSKKYLLHIGYVA